ncbi:MAG: HEAT repeat domain-containing protein [Planctomycetota bacterium]
MRLLVGLVLLASAVVADEGLIELTRDPDRGVRYAAVQALGEAGVGIPAIIDALDDPEWCVRQCAGHALVRVGKAAIPALKQVRRTGEVAARVEAVEALRRLGVADEVLAALDDEAPEVRFEALMGLWLMEKPVPGAREKIEPYIAHDSLRWRVVAYHAMAQVEPESHARIREHLPSIRRWVSREHSWEARWVKRLAEVVAEPDEEPIAEVVFDPDDLKKESRRERGLRAALQAGSTKDHPALTKLLDEEDPDTVKAALIALEWTGADALDMALDFGHYEAALALRSPAAKDVPLLLRALEWERTDAEHRAFLQLVGRAGSAAKAFGQRYGWEPEAGDEEMRALTVWAMGRVGLDVSAYLLDRSRTIRHIAAPFVRDRAFLRRVAGSDDRAARVLALQRLGDLRDDATLRAAARDPDPMIRIVAVQGLGARAPLSLALDPERDVRIALAGEVALESLLRDRNWRVRRASIDSFAREKRGADLLAPFLADRNLALSAAAARALKTMGAPAAFPVAQQLRDGNEASWHYAPEIFEALGADGVSAVPTLVRALAHPNMVAREAAARCLGAIGPAGRKAAPALVEALDDRWLTVISHVAMALGRMGAVEEARRAFAHPKARVRAYAAFVVGWAAGERRGLDQVRYERRFPVLDCGEPGTGLRSKRAWVANLAAAPLTYDAMSPWECERLFELSIAEGFRPGQPIDFGNTRYALGSNELPALLEYLRYAPFTEPRRSSLFGDLHRSPRGENIPAILWFHRNEDWLRNEELGNLHQPFWNTRRYREELLPFLLGREGDVWDLVADPHPISNSEGWWLRTEKLDARRERILVEAYLRPEDHDDDPTEEITARLLGGGQSRIGETLLRWATEETGLARRGDPTAIVRLARAARNDEDALGDLVEFFPRLGPATLRALLSDPTHAGRSAWHVEQIIRSASGFRGTQWHPRRLLGIEPSLRTALLDRKSVLAIARLVPGCRTHRLGRRILERGWGKGPLWSDWVLSDEHLVFLLQVDRERVLRELRRRARGGDANVRFEAQVVLARIGETSDAGLIGEDAWDQLDDAEDTSQYAEFARAALARLLDPHREPVRWASTRAGVPASIDPDEVPAEVVERCRELAARNDVEGVLRVAFPHATVRGDRYWVGSVPEWLRDDVWAHASSGRDTDWSFGALAAGGDVRARAPFWNAMRAGRYWWVVGEKGQVWLTLGDALSTLPHWREELESNCCRISGAVESVFQDLFGVGHLYGCADSGVGEPPAERVLEWFEMFGGDWEWSALHGRYFPKPE